MFMVALQRRTALRCCVGLHVYDSFSLGSLSGGDYWFSDSENSNPFSQNPSFPQLTDSRKLNPHLYDAADLFRVSHSLVATKTGVPCHSFRADTTVLMYDGTRKKISEVVVGDKARTTDPATAVTVVREVTELHVNTDTDLADLTVRYADGRVST
jgi:hypothetical protein